jgi:hypothetical protein
MPTALSVLSNFSLAILADAGWYSVNLAAAEELEYGRGQTLNFLQHDQPTQVRRLHIWMLCDLPGQFSAWFLANGLVSFLTFQGTGVVRVHLADMAMYSLGIRTYIYFDLINKGCRSYL